MDFGQLTKPTGDTTTQSQPGWLGWSQEAEGQPNMCHPCHTFSPGQNTLAEGQLDTFLPEHIPSCTISLGSCSQLLHFPAPSLSPARGCWLTSAELPVLIIRTLRWDLFSLESLRANKGWEYSVSSAHSPRAPVQKGPLR